jgi:CRISP-associated protein Cas1
MELIVEGKGTFLGKHQGRLRVMREQKLVTEVPIIHLKHVLIVSTGVGISSDVVRTCSEEGIPLHFISSRGNAVASLYSAGLTGTVLTRRAQLLAYENKRGVLAAKAFVSGKLENQANLLRYIAKYRKESNPRLSEETRKKIVEKIRERLDSSELYEKKRQALRFIIQSQARHLALFLRNERDRYEPFVAGW